MSVPIKYNIGDKIGNCTYLADDYMVYSPSGQSRRVAKFACVCGNIFEAKVDKVKRGATSSCGCIQYHHQKTGSIKHGMSYTKEYKAWASMLNRCNDKKCKEYKLYGERGIVVCKEWYDFKNFIDYIGISPSIKHSVDRINVNGNYEPGNVRWATKKMQANNKRNNVVITILGISRTLKEWCEYYSLNYKSTHYKIKYKGLTPQQAFNLN